MKPHMEQIPVAQGGKRGIAGVRIVTLIVVAAVIAAGWYYWFGRADSSAIDLSTAKTCRVERGDLTITVLQAGELQAKESNAIINETETSAKVIEIVDDGVLVKKGDVLLQLDAADLEDRILSQQTSLASAEANYTEAVEKRKIDDAKYSTDLDSAQLKVKLAELDLTKYVEAQYPQEILEAEMSLALAEQELIQTSATLESTRILVDK
jgi:HlyD family secretion protein